MNRKPTYDFILEKLGQYPEQDRHALWMNMSQRLDLQMPEDRDRKGFGWMFTLKGFFTIITLSLLSSLAIFIWTKPQDKQAKPDSININNKEIIAKKKSDTIKSFNGTASKADIVKSEPNGSTTTYSVQRTNLKLSDENLNLIHQGSSARKSNEDQEENALVSAPIAHKKIAIAKKLKSTSVLPEKAIASSPDNSAAEPQQLVVRRNQTIAYNKYIQPSIISPKETVNGRKDIAALVATKQQKRQKGFTAGVSLNYNLPASQQEMSTVNINGKSNSLIDYLPSVYVQYHFNKKLLIESELQFISPQYTPDLKLATRSYDYTGSAYKEHEVRLNKLYYLNLPVSVSYSPISHFSIGAGLQYSYLKRSVLEEEDCQWQKNGNDWAMVWDTKSIKVKSNPHKESNGNGNSGNNPVVLTQADTVARSFRSTDWRMLFHASYSWNRLNIGLRFSRGLNNYIHTQVTGYNTTTDVADRNESFQLYLRYNILDLRRNKK
ncbi:MAG: hypothetical protein ACJ75B_07690 [Flavisolibacter sp.]